MIPRTTVGFRTRPLAELEQGPAIVRVKCEICDTREAVYVIEERLEWPTIESKSIDRHLTCQPCLDFHGEVRILSLLSDSVEGESE